MSFANGVQATSVTTGTGDVVLAAVAGFVAFGDAFSIGATVPYAINDGQNWEWGIGTIGTGPVLERTQVLAKLDAGVYSAGGTTAITLSGTSRVYCTLVAEQLTFMEAALVTGGDTHDHTEGRGAPIAYSSVSGVPALGTAAATDATDYAVAAKGVTNGDTHDHNGGDGAQIAYGSLSGTPTLGTAAAANTTAFESAGAISTHNAVTTAHGISAFGATLVDDADAATARTTLVLGNVDNTRDVNKPVSTAQQTALNLKAPTASPTFTGPITAGGSVFITEEGTYPRVSVSGYSTSNWQGPMFQWNRFSGTLLSPLAVASGFTLGWFDVWGHDGSTLARGGQFRCLVDGSVSTGIVPAKWQISSADNTGALRVRLDLLASDNVNVGQNGGSLNVGGGDSSAAKVRIISTTEQLRVGYDSTKYLSVITSSAGVPTLSSTASTLVFAGDIRLDKTITAGGTTGARTINNTLGSVNFAAGASSLVVTNSRVTTSSIIIATVATADATMKSVVAVAAAGSFTIYANAAATAETRVNFTVLN